MQTFLPYEDFKQSAKSLDRQRLGKQRVENIQIMKALYLPEYGWQNHPAVKMWRGYELHLMQYQEAICNEWTSRGYKDTCLEKTRDFLSDKIASKARPSWLGNVQLHLSHQSNLVRKAPEHYGPMWDVSNDLEYVWPS